MLAYVLKSGSHTCLHMCCMYVADHTAGSIISPPTCCCCCATPFDSGFHCSLAHTNKPISLLQKARRKPALTTYTSYPLPYCDAASYTSTLPTEKTTQTPPSQAVNRYYYHLPTVQLTANNTERLPLSYLHPAEVDAAFGHSHLVAEFRSRASRWCVSGRESE